jgi:hypothetical protein
MYEGFELPISVYWSLLGGLIGEKGSTRPLQRCIQNSWSSPKEQGNCNRVQFMNLITSVLFCIQNIIWMQNQLQWVELDSTDWSWNQNCVATKKSCSSFIFSASDWEVMNYHHQHVFFVFAVADFAGQILRLRIPSLIQCCHQACHRNKLDRTVFKYCLHIHHASSSPGRSLQSESPLRSPCSVPQTMHRAIMWRGLPSTAWTPSSDNNGMQRVEIRSCSWTWGSIGATTSKSSSVSSSCPCWSAGVITCFCRRIASSVV